jgi:hypothetical protein
MERMLIVGLVVFYLALGLSLEIPTAPFLDLTVLSGESIQANFTAPLSDGGSAINSYKLDWDTDPGTQEVQVITTATDIGPNEIQVVTTTADDVDEEQVVAMSSTSIAEIQTIVVTGATGGYFFVELDTSADGGSLQYSGYIDVGIPGAASDNPNNDGKDVETIISNMPNIASSGAGVTVEKTGDTDEYQYKIIFPAAMGNVEMMTVKTMGLLPEGASATL